jgi:UDP-GlcNAc:undecaprenyl-phosphate GlcNAc-1-phosphate transferase
VDNFSLGWIAIPVTIFVVVGMINALNMADGVDGLAGGQAVVSLLLFVCFALYAGNDSVAERLLAVAAAVLGFLCWNLRRPGLARAEVFLGDAGSMLLGFIIAWTAIRLSQNPAHPVSPVLGPWTIALPLIDCCSLIIRRLRQGRSPFAGDREHLHHLLLDAGYSQTTIAVGGMIVSLLLGLGAAVALKLGMYRPLLVALFFVLIALHYRLTSDRERAVQFFRRLPFGSSVRGPLESAGK